MECVFQMKASPLENDRASIEGVLTCIDCCKYLIYRWILRNPFERSGISTIDCCYWSMTVSVADLSSRSFSSPMKHFRAIALIGHLYPICTRRRSTVSSCFHQTMKPSASWITHSHHSTTSPSDPAVNRDVCSNHRTMICSSNDRSEFYWHSTVHAMMARRSFSTWTTTNAMFHRTSPRITPLSHVIVVRNGRRRLTRST